MIKEESPNKYVQLFSSVIPNIKQSIYTAIFGKNKIKETSDAIIVGFYIGLISSHLPSIFKEEEITQLIKIYYTKAQGTESIDKLLEIVSFEYSDYLSKSMVKDTDSFTLLSQNDHSNNLPIEDHSNNLPIEDQSNNLPIEDQSNNLPIEDHSNNLANDDIPLELLEQFQYDNIRPKEENPIKRCEICLDDYNVMNHLNYFLDCGCVIHYDCFDKYVVSCVNDNSIPIKCPICKIEVNSSYITESLRQNNHDLLEKYEKFTLDFFALNNKADVNCCPTPGCSYMFFYQEGDAHFVCPTCEKAYCLQCKTDWHDDISCEKNKKLTNVDYLEEEFDKFVKGAQYKKCPFCSAWVEKIEGCDYMSCRCKKHFCYNCGEKEPKSHYCSQKNFGNPQEIPFLNNYPIRRANRRNIGRKRKRN